VSALTATIEPSAQPDGEAAVALRIVNDSEAPIELLNPDLGKPAEGAHWPFSVEAYRAALLMSFGFLTVSVHDESGDEVEKEPVSTWSTPLVRSPVSLAPGGSLEVVIPVGPFFALAPAAAYRVTAEYGDAVKVRAEGNVHT
jgi:hypothetical protein